VVLEVHDALDRLAAEDPVKAEVVKLRFFVGLGNAEIAALLASPKRQSSVIGLRPGLAVPPMRPAGAHAASERTHKARGASAQVGWRSWAA